jgi:hypothetical protein
MRKTIASWALHLAEAFYLLLYGWKKEGKDTWHPPFDFPSRDRPDRLAGYRKGHAVNAQKFWANDKIYSKMRTKTWRQRS